MSNICTTDNIVVDNGSPVCRQSLYGDVNNITFVGKNVKNLVYANRRIVHTMLATIFLQTNTSSVDNR